MKIGVWIDFRQAYVIQVDRDSSLVKQLESDIESYRAVGGSRSNVPYGPVDTVSESKFLERKRHQSINYFDAIIENLKPNDSILIFGPAEAKKGLRKRLLDHTNKSITVLDCLQADSMTENQMIAYVKEYYDLPTRLG